MSNRLFLIERILVDFVRNFRKNGFLLIELVAALGIIVFFCAIIVRSQKNAWFLIHRCIVRTDLLDESIDRFERRGCFVDGVVQRTVLQKIQEKRAEG